MRVGSGPVLHEMRSMTVVNVEYSNDGFTIARRDDRIVFVDRYALGGLALPLLAGGAAVMFGLMSIGIIVGIAAGSDFPTTLLPSAGIGLAMAAVAAYFARKGWGRHRRKDLSDEEATTVVADLSSGRLVESDGEVVAALEEVTTRRVFDPWDGLTGWGSALSEGSLPFAYFLELRWPGGRQKVYKSGSRAELDEIGDELASLFESA